MTERKKPKRYCEEMIRQKEIMMERKEKQMATMNPKGNKEAKKRLEKKESKKEGRE